MSIPIECNPIGQNINSDPPGPGVQYEDIVEGEYNTKIPMPYFLKYQLDYDCDFLQRGTLQVTHVILGKFIAQHEGLYIGWSGVNIKTDYQYKREELNWLAEEPSPVAGELTNIVCTLLGGTLDPVEIGPGMGTYSQILPYGTASQMKAVEFQKIIVDGEERFIYAYDCTTINFNKGYLNPIVTATRKTTTAPDGKLHVQMKAKNFTNNDAYFGLRYLIRLK